MHRIPSDSVEYLTYNKLMKVLKVMMTISKPPQLFQGFYYPIIFVIAMNNGKNQWKKPNHPMQCCLLSYGARSEVPLRRSRWIGNPINKSASRPTMNLWTPSVRSRKDPEGLGPAPVPGLIWDVVDFVKSFREYGSSAKKGLEDLTWDTSVDHSQTPWLEFGQGFATC